MSLNKIMLIGHVGKEPDVRTLEGGIKVASLSLATTDKSYTLANGTQVPERTEWHNIVVWRGQAETVEKYVHKGDKLYIEGKSRTRNYDDKNGIKHYITEVFTDYMEMLSVKPQSPQPPASPIPQSPLTSSQNQQPPAYQPPQNDDLPF